MNDGAESGGLGDAPATPESNVGDTANDSTTDVSNSGAAALPAADPTPPGGVPVDSPEPAGVTFQPPIEPAPTLAEVDREVEEAMAAMDATDRAELQGGGGTSESMEPGTELTGIVVTVGGDDVFLDVGAKSQAVMPKSQFGKNEKLDVGRRVDVVIERYDETSGLIIANRQGATLRANWNTLAVGNVVAGKVTGVIKGGLEVSLSGIRAFMPASQVDVVHIKDVSLLLNENIRCEVVELDRRGKNVLVSRRRVLEREVAESREATRKELAVGQVRKGIVKTIVEFGAFIDLGGIDGLAHISDLAWSSVNKVSDVLKPGQEVEVQILKIDDKRDRISLGLKQCQPDPWGKVENTYPVGTALKVRVLRLADFGAFAELEPGIDGLIPISELGWSRVRTVSEVLSVGDMIDVVVIRYEAAKRRLALSVKQARPDPWVEVLESFPANSLVKGKVTRLADFGAFVELVPGVEGLIHISELSDQRVRACSDVLSEGQEVEARVLSVDLEQRRISLSIKAVKEAVSRAETEPVVAAKPKKRKKPLRGGLSSHYDW